MESFTLWLPYKIVEYVPACNLVLCTDRLENLSPHLTIFGDKNSVICFMMSFLMFDRETPPLPDVGQWLLLALNEKLPQLVVDIMRARIIGLHHFLMLFVMLGFSVLFNSVEAPGLGLGARYMFTMGIGRLLRTIAFVSTIVPSPRPWCATARFQVPPHPHYWAQKYYVPYANDSSAIRHIIRHDIAYGTSLSQICFDYCNHAQCFLEVLCWLVSVLSLSCYRRTWCWLPTKLGLNELSCWISATYCLWRIFFVVQSSEKSWRRVQWPNIQWPRACCCLNCYGMDSTYENLKTIQVISIFLS